MNDLDPEDPDLLDDLEIACLDAIRGDSPSAALATRVQRACIDVLRARGVESPLVRCQLDPRGTFVQIGLPRPGNKVEQVVLKLQ